MISLGALSIGQALPVHAKGQICHVRDQTCHIQLENGAWLNLLAASCQNAPMSIRLDYDGSFHRLFTQGAWFSLRHGYWSTRGCHGSLHLAARYLPGPSRSLLAREQVRANLAYCRQLWLHAPQSDADRLAGFDRQWLYAPLCELVQACDITGIQNLLPQLIKLAGESLPHGDDLLLGVLAALFRLRSVAPRWQALLSGIRQVLPAMLQHSSAARAHSLCLALNGLFAEPLQGLAEDLLVEAGQELLQTRLYSALTQGIQSGPQGVLGLLVTLGAEFEGELKST